MTAPAADPPRPPDTDGRFRFGRTLIAVEAAITAVEVVLVLGPTLALAAISLQHAGDVRQVAILIGALMVLAWVRAADLVRPIIAARNAKRAGRALDAAEIAATERAVRRAPFEVAFTRWLLWSAASVYLAVHLASRGLLDAVASVTVTLFGSLAAIPFLRMAGR